MIERKEHTSKMSQGLMIEDCKQQIGEMIAIETLKSVTRDNEGRRRENLDAEEME